MKTITLIIIILISFIGSISLHAQSKKDIKAAKKIIKRADALLQEEIPNFNGALNLYLDAIKLDPENADLNFNIGVCYLRSIHKTKAIPYIEKALKGDSEINPEARFLLGRTYHWDMKFNKAIKEFQKYKAGLSKKELKKKEVLRWLAIFVADRRIEQRSEYVIVAGLDKIIDKRIRECEIAKEMIKNPEDVTIENIGRSINSPFPDYAPVISADESVMYFTSRRRGTVGEERDPFDGKFYEDIYVSYNENGKWSKAENVGTTVNTKNHDSGIGLSADGQTMFTYSYEGRGDIYISKLRGKDWSRPKSISKKINTPNYAERSIALSGDERMMIFVSDKEGGNGGRDIYKSMKDDKGRWGDPENIGPVINTEFDEDGVFFHPDGKTFYFSSKGHKSMGGYDIFKTTYDDGKWSKPENMGYPINTVNDDIFFVVAANGERAYYSAERSDSKGAQDIYVINLKKPEPEEVETEEPINPLTLLKGVITDALTKKPLEAVIQLVDNEANEEIAEFTSNSYSGKYLVTLPSGKNYGIAVEKQGYMFHSENFDIPASSDYQEIIKNIELKKIAVGTKIVLKNIFFDFDKATLRKASIAELERLMKFLSEFPAMKIEISGHTDNKGSAEYNQKLSEKRAKSVVQWLVERGIPSSRLQAKGYGEAKPIAPNKFEDGTDNPDGRQQNRRTEFEILENN